MGILVFIVFTVLITPVGLVIFQVKLVPDVVPPEVVFPMTPETLPVKTIVFPAHNGALELEKAVNVPPEAINVVKV